MEIKGLCLECNTLYNVMRCEGMCPKCQSRNKRIPTVRQRFCGKKYPRRDRSSKWITEADKNGGCKSN